jgi:peptide/nickel transport system permease protein
MKKKGEFRSIHWYTVFLRRKSNKVIFSLVILWVLVAILADFIATDHPLVVTYNNETSFPAFNAIFQSNSTSSNTINWKQAETEFILWAPIPWSHETPDVYNRDFTGPFDNQMIKGKTGEMISMPFRHRHLLGTDRLGRDLFSMIIHASRISLKIGLLSTLIAGLIGITLGGISGYYGNSGFIVFRSQYILGTIGLALGLFWAFISRSTIIGAAFETNLTQSVLQVLLSFFILSVTTFTFYKLGLYLNPGNWLKKKVSIPFDDIIQRFSELFSTLPKILLLLTLAAILKDKSVGVVVLIIGLTGWTGVSRFTRAEVLKVRNLPFIEAAKVQGFSNTSILGRYALPNSMGPVFIELAFLVSGSILAESSLSFLGVGVPVEIATWGSILSEGRQDFDAWWMVIFPGLAIFFAVVLFNSLGERLRSMKTNS